MKLAKNACGEAMNQIETRTLTFKDYDAIINLWKQAGLQFKPKGRDSRQSMKQQMKAFPEFFIGAYYQEKLIGVVIGSYDGRMKGWINRLAVYPAYRRKGVAQHLTKAIEKALRKHGTTIFCALIESPNRESLRLFQKMGYTAHKDVLYVTKRLGEDV